MRRYAHYVQIIPADGWWAIYEMEDGSREKSKISAIALCRHENVDDHLIFLDAPDDAGLCDDVYETSNCRGVFYQGSKELEGL